MRLLSAIAAAFPLVSACLAASAAHASDAPRLSGPFTHENLSVYFVHGASAPGPVPLTLQEALDRKAVEVVETGSVNELKIRNKGGEPIFIQSGDIVKGGKQDRVVTTSFLLPPRSGEVPLASFCVEHGRWSPRGQEAAGHFSSSAEALPSRKAKLAMKAPLPAAEAAPVAEQQVQSANRRQSARNDEAAQRRQGASRNDTGARQQMVWNEVAATQDKLSGGLNQSVNAAESSTSLQLSLENKQLRAARADYAAALEGKAGADDVVGYVFAVNGQINSADLYPSNALFRKMWPKLLAASVTEAIGDSATGTGTPPDIATVQAFLAGAESGQAQEEAVADIATQDVRDTEKALYVGVKTRSGDWVHRNYLMK